MRVRRRDALALVTLGGAGASGCAVLERFSKKAPERTPPLFLHGVASGDPGPDRVVIWTRATPQDVAAPGDKSAKDDVAPEPFVLVWQVAHDAGFTDLAATGEVLASASTDFTAKADVRGLAPGVRYFYRFTCLGAASDVGRTATLPEGAVETMTLAVCSCSNYPFGFFHAYRDMAERAPDLILHLGDYIYEYGAGSYGDEVGAKIGRRHSPPHETVTLSDYRARHAQYRADPDLQAAAAVAPWITSWDDHEITNNPWRDGAENHDEGEGSWADRQAAALRAYFEWMPVRDPAPGQPRATFWRAFELGDLATLVMLETRLTGRDEQLVYARDLPEPDDEAARASFLARLNDPDRTMIDPRQERFVVDACRASVAAGKPWQVIGDQVIFARQTTPDLEAAWDEATKTRLAADRPWTIGARARGRHGLPSNLDAWDGYPVQRDRISDALGELGAGLVMLAGDTHTSWVNTVHDTAGSVIGVEFGAAGVTSPGWIGQYGPAEPSFETLVVRENSDVAWVEGAANGYVVVTLTRQAATGVFLDVGDVTQPRGPVSELSSWRMERGEGPGKPPLAPLRVIGDDGDAT